MLGYAFTGSFCNMKRAVDEMEKLVKEGHEILPIMSYNVYTTDTKFGTAESLIKRVREITGKDIIHTIPDAEPIGPKTKLDCLCISPCSGNTMAKLAHGICDTPVCMAAKAHLRNCRPLVIALASNDALAANAPNLGIMLGRKNVYFVPIAEDDPEGKPASLVCDFSRLGETIDAALCGRQAQKIFF